MPHSFTPKVVTANRLVEGDVVYLTVQNQWTPTLSEAEILTDEADADLRLLDASSQTNLVVGAYLMDVTEDHTPTHFREEFRQRGPSNYFHGKQAEISNV